MAFRGHRSSFVSSPPPPPPPSPDPHQRSNGAVNGAATSSEIVSKHPNPIPPTPWHKGFTKSQSMHAGSRVGQLSIGQLSRLPDRRSLPPRFSTSSVPSNLDRLRDVSNRGSPNLNTPASSDSDNLSKKCSSEDNLKAKDSRQEITSPIPISGAATQSRVDSNGLSIPMSPNAVDSQSQDLGHMPETDRTSLPSQRTHPKTSSSHSDLQDIDFSDGAGSDSNKGVYRYIRAMMGLPDIPDPVLPHSHMNMDNWFYTSSGLGVSPMSPNIPCYPVNVVPNQPPFTPVQPNDRLPSNTNLPPYLQTTVNVPSLQSTTITPSFGQEQQEAIGIEDEQEHDDWSVMDESGFGFFYFNAHKEEPHPPKPQPTSTTDSDSGDDNKGVEKPAPQPPPLDQVKGDQYEHLRKRPFRDRESESFCQMVTDLKLQYPSTNEETNIGYLINQIRDNPMDSVQVKIVVHSTPSSESVIFTCDTNTLVEHVISHVLDTISPNDTQPETDLFILKVFERTEYLANDLPLSKFEYIHSCQKLDRDIYLELMSREEVCRPFKRTTDDDEQSLDFRDMITYITQNYLRTNLETLLENFYKEVDALLEQVNQSYVETGQVQAVEQSVKDLCMNLAKIETTGITTSLSRLKDFVAESNNPSVESQGFQEENVAQGEEAERPSKVALGHANKEDIEISIRWLVDAVKRLVRLYCNTFLTDFIIGQATETPNDVVEINKVQDSFGAGITSAHRIPMEWQEKFYEYKAVCSLFHGTRKLLADVSTSSKPLTCDLCEAIVWDEWVQFDDVVMSTLPRETRLHITLYGLRNIPGKNANKGDNPQRKQVTFPLCTADIQLYDERGHLHQGPQLVPLVMGASSDPIMPSCKTLLPDSVLLQVNLPDFDRTIFFPPPDYVDVDLNDFSQLSPEIQALLTNYMERESWSSLKPDELTKLWSYRHYVTDTPSLLPCVLHAAHSWEWASLPEIYGLMRRWKTLNPMQAFDLLLPQFPDIQVREFATQCLNRIPTDDLICFLPQMIQALKFESYHNSPLARLLLEQSCKSPRFAHQFFWLLKDVAFQETIFRRHYELMFIALASVVGVATVQELEKQGELIKHMSFVAQNIKSDKDKDVRLKRELVSLHEFLEKSERVFLPYNPSMEVVGLDMKVSSYFASNAFPIKFVFKNSNPKADSHFLIYKVGDDLRQDMLTMQLINIMDSLWLQHKLDLRMITFACLPTGPKKGMIEFITDSTTLRKIQVSHGVTGSFRAGSIKEWLQKHNPKELDYRMAVKNFTHSCAGYCVATYVLGICDRHNDNIMVKQSGHMFHIDFGKFLGDSQMFGNFERDRVPFVLTSDMAYVINDGAKQSGKFQDFVDLCCQAFNILRRHANLFRSLFFLMSRSGIPNVTEEAVQYIDNALLIGQTDGQAAATFTRMIEESMNSMSTELNFFIHNIAQLKFSSHNEGELLSFISKTYSKYTDGQIASVEFTDYEKRYQPEKHYMFILKVMRENQKVPTYIFRQFIEFVEFRDKLNETFALVRWPNFSTRLVIGRSNVRSVAESRKMEIIHFLNHLWTMSPEITECELVYTFFHPLLRDEQEDLNSSPNIPKLESSIPNDV